MDDTRFGSFESAKILVKLISNNDKLERKVGAFIADYTTGLRQIKNIENIAYRKRLALLWRKHFENRIDFGYRINSFVESVIVAYYRNTIKW